MTIGCLLVLLALVASSGQFDFRQKLDQAISKAKQYYKSRFGKDKQWQFLGYDKSEYPGTDAELRELNRQKWEEYYDCLRMQNENLGPHGSAVPEATMRFVGESVTFECKVCTSPSERENNDMIEWEWSAGGSQHLEPVEYTEHTLLSPEDKTLMMYNLDVSHTGQYICKLGYQLTVPYFLTVVNNSEPLKRVYPKTAAGKPHRMKPWKITADVVLDTVWNKWSPCSRCDRVGKRHRVGYCTIFVLSNIGDFPTNDTEFENKMVRKANITRSDMEVLGIFKYGIPCRSHITPKSVQMIYSVRNRESEVLVDFCRIKCPEDQIFELKSGDGKVLETANNSAGIYSMLQGLPQVEPPVERRLRYETEGKGITISCPGNLNMEAPILWQIGKKNVVPELLSKESGGRIYVTVLDNIVIKKARETDSNIYSCWQRQELAGTVRLVVERKFEMNFKKHVMLTVVVVIFGYFTYVLLRAYRGKGRVEKVLGEAR